MIARLLMTPLVALAVLGCGEAPPPQPISGPPAEAAELVSTLGRATAARDFELICDDLYSAAVRRAAGGARCPDLLERTTGDLRSPAIEIEGIEIGEDSALVTVIARARDQTPATETIRLERDLRDDFRITGLN